MVIIIFSIHYYQYNEETLEGYEIKVFLLFKVSYNWNLVTPKFSLEQLSKNTNKALEELCVVSSLKS